MAVRLRVREHVIFVAIKGATILIWRFRNSLAGGSAGLDEFDMREVDEPLERDRLFALLPQPTLVQSPAYGLAVGRARGMEVRYFCIEKEGNPAALVQVRTKRTARLPIGSRIEQGPMFFSPLPAPESRHNVMQLLRRRFRLLRGKPLKILPALDDCEENRALLLGLGFRDMQKGYWWSARLDLSRSEEELRARLSSSWRRQLNGSIRKGVQLEVSSSPESVQWLISKHKLNMAQKGFAGPDPAFVWALYEAAPQNFHVLKATLDGETLCGACWIRFGCCAQSLVGWFGEAGRAVNAGNFLYWHAILEMKRLGCSRFDVGGTPPGHGYTHFKQGMGGESFKFCGDWLSV